MSGLILVGVGLPSVSADALVVEGVPIWFFTDSDSGSTDPVTVTSEDEFTIAGDEDITLNTTADTFLGDLDDGASCNVSVSQNGAFEFDLDCVVPAQRVVFAKDASTMAAGILSPTAIAGYAEAFMGNGGNSQVTFTHEIKLTNGDLVATNTITSNTIPWIYSNQDQPFLPSCPLGESMIGWMNVTTPDGWKFSNSRTIATCA